MEQISEMVGLEIASTLVNVFLGQYTDMIKISTHGETVQVLLTFAKTAVASY